MKNLWIQKEFTIASWYADVTAIIDRADVLLSLVGAIYKVAAETEMVCPLGLDPSTLVSQRWESERVVDVFRALGRTPVEAKIAWFDASDKVTEGLVGDLGELLESLQPVSNSIASGNRAVGQPPVTIGGVQVEYALDGSTTAPNTVSFGVDLYSDIWFPYVLGLAHPAADAKRFFDNRELSDRHTSRLNILLKTVAELVEEAGGTWQIDEGGTIPAYSRWIGPAGIKLDTAAPELMPASCLEVEWPDLDS